MAVNLTFAEWGIAMHTFKEVADSWLEQNDADNIDCKLVLSDIGELEIGQLSSEKAQDCLIDLYDNKKIRGKIYASYEKFVSEVAKYAYECGYIPEIPKIEPRNEPAPNLYFKPDTPAMLLLISHEDLTPTGTILRLAWYCGLMRNEIASLLWLQVDLAKRRLVLSERTVPLNKEMCEYLRQLKKKNAGVSEYVLVSQRGSAPLAEQSISALARKALDNYGQKNVRLNDLRCDFIISQLEVKSLEQVSYISGITLPALRQHYLPHATERISTGESVETKLNQNVRKQLLDFIEKEKTGLCGLALRFVWQFGIPVPVLPKLSWDIVDFEKAEMIFTDRTINIPPDFLNILRVVRESRDGEYCNILLNESKGKPTDSVFLRKTVQQALIRTGIRGILLSDLQNDYWKTHYSVLKVLKVPYGEECEIYSIPRRFPSEIAMPSEAKLLSYLKKNSFADSKTIKEIFGFTDSEAHLLLRSLLGTGKIVRVGVRYFLPDNIVERERQKAVILEYVGENQPVSSAQLTKILGLTERRQVFGVINPLLQSGELVRTARNCYCLPDNNDSMETA